MLSNHWRITTADVYRSIYSAHRRQLIVFGSETCTEGNLIHPGRYIMTEWGFRNCEVPLIKSVRENPTLESDDICTYYIAVPYEGEPEWAMEAVLL